MAIQMRRGSHIRFDPSRLVAGEWAVVLSGDPVAKDGKAVYVCFAAGDVKRMATYEDMQDFLLGLQEQIVAYTVDDATGEVRAEYMEMMDGASRAEAERVANELRRVGSEASRESAEEARASAEEARAGAEERREVTIREFEEKVLAGFFDGATFTPSVSADGLLSWTNDKGLPNPGTVDVRGPAGKDGAVTQLAAGMFALKIIDGRLKVICGAESEPPDMEIGADGHLYIRIGDKA